jgi:hypothetical protein
MANSETDHNILSSMSTLETVCTGGSRYTRFRYPRFYFSVMRSIDIPSRISGSHGGWYEDGCLLGCSAV